MGRGNKIKKIICLLTILTVVSSCISVHATELEGSKEDIDARSTEVNEISVETKSEIEDTEAGMQEETETPEVVGFTPKLVDFSLSQNTISLKYHDYVTYNVIGKSERGKNIYDIVLGNPNADRTVLVVCTLYAREYVTSVMAMKQLKYYLRNYNSKVDGARISSIFEKCNIHYNPDEIEIAQNKKPTWKANANNVNLNNNFNCHFKCGKAIDDSSTGRKAESEKETQAIAKLSRKLAKQKR